MDVKATTFRLPLPVIKKIAAVERFINKKNPCQRKTCKTDVVIEAINMYHDFMIKFEEEVPS